MSCLFYYGLFYIISVMTSIWISYASENIQKRALQIPPAWFGYPFNFLHADTPPKEGITTQPLRKQKIPTKRRDQWLFSKAWGKLGFSPFHEQKDTLRENGGEEKDVCLKSSFDA